MTGFLRNRKRQALGRSSLPDAPGVPDRTMKVRGLPTSSGADFIRSEPDFPAAKRVAAFAAEHPKRTAPDAGDLKLVQRDIDVGATDISVNGHILIGSIQGLALNFKGMKDQTAPESFVRISSANPQPVFFEFDVTLGYLIVIEQ